MGENPILILMLPMAWSAELYYSPNNEGPGAAAGAFSVWPNSSHPLAIGLHIVAALKHHIIDKDATLKRILARRLPRAGAEPSEYYD